MGNKKSGEGIIRVEGMKDVPVLNMTLITILCF
jgi:hypothetical protein